MCKRFHYLEKRVIADHQTEKSQTENHRKKKKKRFASIYWENNVLLPACADYIPEKPCW